MIAFRVGLFDRCSLLSYTEELRKSFGGRPPTRAEISEFGFRISTNSLTSRLDNRLLSRIEYRITPAEVRRQGCRSSTGQAPRCEYRGCLSDTWCGGDDGVPSPREDPLARDCRMVSSGPPRRFGVGCRLETRLGASRGGGGSCRPLVCWKDTCCRTLGHLVGRVLCVNLLVYG